MEIVFDRSIVDTLMSTAQLSQADVARALNVSREAVSNWMSGESVPRPRHRTLLAALLGVSVSALAGSTPPVREPIVAYRKKGTRKVKDEQTAWIKRDMIWLEVLEKRFSASSWAERVPEHRGAATEEEARFIAARFRSELGLDPNDELIAGHRLLSWLAGRGICLVPVFWGAKEHPLNAMYVRLPESDVHWLYVNLDASVVDIRFWLLHEIAHIIRRRPHDADGAEELFADTFAAEVLFPSGQVKDYVNIGDLQAPREQYDAIYRLAVTRGISPVTVYRQVNSVLRLAGSALLDLDGVVYPRALALAKTTPTWADGLFGGQVQTGLRFVVTCTERLETPVFRLAAMEILENGRGYGFIERVFQCGTADAMALHQALTEYGTAKDPR